MTFISYAQNQEDVMLFRALGHVKAGFYIDVGAQCPSTGSVTRAFYDRGWRGINIEPVDEFFTELQEERAEDLNLKIAVATHAGELQLHQIPHTGLSTTSEEIASRHRDSGFETTVITVPCSTLDAICREYAVEEVHFLKVDVEGAEADVLSSFSFDTIRPWIMVIEATAPNLAVDTSSEWEDFVLSKDYELAYFDGLNRFYVAAERAQLRKAFDRPPNYFDEFVPVVEWQQAKDLVAVTASLAEADLAYKNMIREAERLTANLIETRADADRLHAAMEISSAALESSNAERARLADTVARMARENSTLDSELVATRQERDENARRLGDLPILQAGIAQRDARIAELSQLSETLEATVARLRDAIWREQENLRLLVSSRSWKVSEPLRMSKRLVGRLARAGDDLRNARGRVTKRSVVAAVRAHLLRPAPEEPVAERVASVPPVVASDPSSLPRSARRILAGLDALYDVRAVEQ